MKKTFQKAAFALIATLSAVVSIQAECAETRRICTANCGYFIPHREGFGGAAETLELFTFPITVEAGSEASAMNLLQRACERKSSSAVLYSGIRYDFTAKGTVAKEVLIRAKGADDIVCTVPETSLDR